MEAKQMEPVEDAVSNERAAGKVLQQADAVTRGYEVTGAAKLRELLQSFDRLALTVDPRTGEERYEAWAVPMAKELHEKFIQYQRDHADEIPTHDENDAEAPGDGQEEDLDQPYDDEDARTQAIYDKHEWRVDFDDELPFLYDDRPRGRKPVKKSKKKAKRVTTRRKKPGPQPQLPSELKSLIYQLWESNELASKRGRDAKRRADRNKLMKSNQTGLKIKTLEKEVARLSATLESGKAFKVDEDEINEEMDARTRAKTQKLIDLMSSLQDKHDAQQNELERLQGTQKEMASRHMELSLDGATHANKKGHLFTEREALHREWIKVRMKADEKRNQLDDMNQLIKDLEMSKQILEKQNDMMNYELEKGPGGLHAEQDKIDKLTELLNTHTKKKEEAELRLQQTEARLLGLQDKERHLLRQIGREKEQNQAYREQLDRMREVVDVVLDDDDRKREKLERTLQDLRNKVADSHKYALSPHQKFQSLVHKYLTYIYRKACDEHYHHVSLLEAKAQAELKRVKDGLDAHANRQDGWEADTHGHMYEMLKARQDLFLELKTSYLKGKAQLDEDNRLMEDKKAALRKTNRQIESLKYKIEMQQAPVEEVKTFQNFVLDSFKGDYLVLNQDASALSVVHRTGDMEVLFSDIVQKINRHDRKDKRSMIITEKSILVLTPQKPWKLKRRILIDDLIYVSLSRNNSQVFVLHHKTENDYLILSPKRGEIIFLLMQQMMKRTGHPLKVVVEEKLVVGDKGLVNREINVVKAGQLQTTRQIDPSRIELEDEKIILTHKMRNATMKRHV